MLLHAACTFLYRQYFYRWTEHCRADGVVGICAANDVRWTASRTFLLQMAKNWTPESVVSISVRSCCNSKEREGKDIRKRPYLCLRSNLGHTRYGTGTI